MTTTQPPTPNATPDEYSADHTAAGRPSVPMATDLPSSGRRDQIAAQASDAPIMVRRSTTSASLRGKRYDIVLAGVDRIVEDGTDGLRVRYEQNDERETVGIMFDANTIAEIEERYGSMDDWQKAVNKKPIAGIRATLAICLEREDKAVGAAMIVEERQNYMAAIGLAFAVANGVDPTLIEQAVSLVEQGMSVPDAFQQMGIGGGEAPQRNG